MRWTRLHCDPGRRRGDHGTARAPPPHRRSGKAGQGRPGRPGTPLETKHELGRALGLRGPLLVKRDDLAGPGLGGNKARKLQYVLAEALACEADCLVTIGAVQSNHARLTAVCGCLVGPN